MALSLQRILLATDGSQDATLAARAAADLARRSDAELHVVHAWTGVPPTAYHALSGGYYSHLYEEEAGRLLETEVRRIREAGGPVAEAHLREGRAMDEIVALADELEVDLVALGSRGAGPVKRLVTGSVPEGVVNLCSRPVLVTRGGEGAWPPASVVVGDDSSETARRAGRFAAALGGLLGASTLLVRAYPRGPETRKISDEIRAAADQALQRRANELKAHSGRRPRVRVEVGDPAAIIQRIAEETGEGTLVAVGSQGLGAARRLALGGVSMDVLRAVDGPVLVCPPAGEH